MEDSNLKHVSDLLRSYGIYDDFRLKDTPHDGFDFFLQSFTAAVQQKYSQNQAVDLLCLISIISELSLHLWDRDDDAILVHLINLFPFFRLKNTSICRTIDILRLSLKSVESSSEKISSRRVRLPLNLHGPILAALHSRILSDDPPHVAFPGDKESFLQVSSIPWQSTNGYTMLIWLKIPSSTTIKGFEIFRCRNPQLTIDVAMIYIPEEGSYTIRIVTNSERRGRDEIRGKFLMSADNWHLLSIKHTNPSAGADQMVVAVDGSVFIENELSFPSAVVLNNESHWTFGMGFHGLMSNIMFYESDLPNQAIKFIYSLGPYITELRQGVSVPQSSYDSGHVILGTQVSKGPWAAKLSTYAMGFHVTALVVSSGGTFAQSKSSDVSNNYYVEMIPQVVEHESQVVVSATGKCASYLYNSCVENIVEAGGVGLFLYLLWSYSTSKTDDFAEDKGPEEQRLLLKQCILSCIEIIASLIKAHADLKEQFIQMHGFHIVAHCISSMQTDIKNLMLSKGLIDSCVHLVEALGVDGTLGDGVASALQGLLFDFRVWGGCNLPTLKYFLECTSTLTLKAGDQLYKCIGMQKLLDIFRVHISKVINVAKIGNQGLVGEACSLTSPEQLAKDCANEVHRMMIIIKDAAVDSALKTKAEAVLDTDSLLICLAETNNAYLAERILRLLSNIKVTHPAILQRSLIANRFYDTIVISLWVKKGMSLEVRGAGLTYLLWLLDLELREAPQQIIQLRQSLNGPLGVGSNASNKRGRGSVSNDPQKTKMLLSQIKDQIKPLAKWWKVLHMLSDTLAKALIEGVWGELGRSKLVMFASKENISSVGLLTVDPVDSDSALSFIIQEISVNYQRDAWLLLPFLPVLLSKVDIVACQKVLMQVNVQFKTDEAQCEALANLDDRSWMDLLIQLAMIGEVCSEVGGKSSGDETSVAKTCVEMSLEVLCIVLDYKIKFHPSNSTNIWTTLEESLNSMCKANIVDPQSALVTEKRMLRRCISLILQKLVKSLDENWNTLTFANVDSLFCLISARGLCGIVPYKEDLLSAKQPEIDLLGMETEPKQTVGGIKSSEETYILSLVLDVMRSARKLPTKISFGGAEWSLLRNGFANVLNCLPITPDELHERLDEEILGYVKRVCEPTAPFSSDEFTKLIMQVLFSLKSATYNNNTASHARTKYTGTILEIIMFFTSLRRSFITRNVPIPSHMDDLMGMLAMVENFNDISMIFEMLDAMVRERNVLSTMSAVAKAMTAPSVEDHGIIDYTTVPDPQDNLINFALLDELPVLMMPDATSPLFPEINKADADGSIVYPQDDMSIASKEPGESDLTPPVPSAEPSENKGFTNWLKVRQGIIAERVDTERARLTRIMNAQDLSSEAAKKFWRKCRRKIETESLGEAHKCQWKLGVAHEGNFFGRKRIVLRPRYDNIYQSKLEEVSIDKESEISSDELNRALARQCSGYIRDVTQSEAGVDAKEDPADFKTADSVLSSEDGKGDSKAGTVIPGTGWGLVDADGSDEGFGVVGLIQDPVYMADDSSKKIAPSSKNTSGDSKTDKTSPLPEPNLVGDMMGDVHVLEESLRLGRGVIETGPCHTGTYRIGSGPARIEARVVMVTASGNFWGFLSFNGKEIFFRSSFEHEDVNKEDNAAVNLVKEQRMRRRRWLLSTVSAIYLRRFRLRDSALEVFFRRGKHRNFFVDFGHTKENAKQRNDFAKALMQAAPQNAFKQAPGMNPFRMVFEHGVQEKWLAGQMSNFDYLMALNTLAGRSYNDLCQYPVMPWVISDYTSESLDLKNPNIYRDLSKPMGALNENRLKEFMSRFESFEDNISSGIPAFMYGSHYSTMVGVVLHFLVRLQPFAALHREMQNGHFDVPDRLFSSIPRSFAHNTTQLSEVKELIPEWFTTPDMFRNVNHFDFGRTQDGDSIADVELPPWAKSPEDFVRIHREALESDYVTEHLHEWIDLIFGYKQRGPDAVAAKNVFYYLTYYGAVDHYMIEDETLRRATELQIAHFGQVPMQLFKTPHPARKVNSSSAGLPIMRPLKANFQFANAKEMQPARCDEESIALQAPCTLISRKNQTAIILMTIFRDRIVCILDNGVVEVLKYATSEEAKAALALRAAINAENAKAGKSSKGRKVLEDNSNHDLLDLYESQPTSDSTEDVKEYSAATYSFLREGEVLVYVEKEYAHFDSLPRIPLPRNIRLLSEQISNQRNPLNAKISGPDLMSIVKVRPQLKTSMTNAEKLSQLVVCSRSSRLTLVAGRIDGAVMVREFEDKTGAIKSAGEFIAHRRRVVSIAMDTNPPEYDLVATLDEAGTILVWTILNTKSKQLTQHPVHIISRRPQRQFRCDPPCLLPEEDPKNPLPLHVDISSQMGIVVAVSGQKVYIYSIERNELLKRFTLGCSRNSMSATQNEETEGCGFSYSGSAEDTSEQRVYHTLPLAEDATATKYFARRMVLSDFGMVVVNVESYLYMETTEDFEEQLHTQHLLLSHTVSGVLTASVICTSAITALTCPDRGDVFITGQADGAVRFYRVQDLSLLYELYPHTYCSTISLGVLGMTTQPQPSGKSRKNSTNVDFMNNPLSVAPSPIICITVGPNRTAPSTICMSAESGAVFVKALPDFVRWEKQRQPSALAQLVNSAPLQAVKGTLLQAQNWTQETASVIAQNAKFLADDAVTELKKFGQRNSIVKGVVSFFGVGKTASTEDSGKSNASKK